MKSNIHPVEPEELMAYLDGELPVERAAKTAAHLQECRECQIVAAEFKSVSESLAAWDVQEKEPQLSPELVAALEERESGERGASSGGRRNWFGGGGFRRLTPWFGGALAGGVAALLLAFSLIFTAGKSAHKTLQTTAQTATSSPQLSKVEVEPPPPVTRDRLNAQARANLTATESAASAQREVASRLASNLEVNPSPVRSAEIPTAPMILRTAQITVVVQNLDKARAGIDQIVQRFGGYVGELSTSAPGDGPRKLSATLRVPGTQLDAALAELKTLGRVEAESQTGQDVTAQYVDLEARLSNSRNTEQRLLDLLRQRTGKLSDVLEVETELSRVREEIERMEGERRLLSKQVAFATITASLTEEYKAPAGPLPDSLGTRFRNAAVEGYQSVVNFILGVALFLISDGPMLLLWTAILFFPARYAWRRLRNR